MQQQSAERQQINYCHFLWGNTNIFIYRKELSLSSFILPIIFYSESIYKQAESRWIISFQSINHWFLFPSFLRLGLMSSYVSSFEFHHLNHSASRKEFSCLLNRLQLENRKHHSCLFWRGRIRLKKKIEVVFVLTPKDTLCMWKMCGIHDKSSISDNLKCFAQPAATNDPIPDKWKIMDGWIDVSCSW